MTCTNINDKGIKNSFKEGRKGKWGIIQLEGNGSVNQPKEWSEAIVQSML